MALFLSGMCTLIGYGNLCISRSNVGVGGTGAAAWCGLRGMLWHSWHASQSLGKFSVFCFCAGTGSKQVRVLFKCGVLISHSSLALLDISPAGFQSQMLWWLILVQVSWDRETTRGSESSSGLEGISSVVMSLLLVGCHTGGGVFQLDCISTPCYTS